MAKVFYFSKRFSQQGEPVKAVAQADLITISRPVPVALPYKLGFRTYSTTLQKLKEYSIAELKANGVKFQYSNGLKGDGSAANPLTIDSDWVNKEYVRTEDIPISQVGDPTEQTLPIAGSYFSVCYPFLDNSTGSMTPYVEGNGDLRILRHVTNGERVAVVYSVWKNYKNTKVNTTKHTDIVYRPPGLAADEYIFHVMTASDTAMLAEIHNAAGFKEYAFVTLNGTLMAEAHTLLRLGKTPLSALIGATTNTWISYFRNVNMSAVIVAGVKYLIGVLPAGVTVLGNSSINRIVAGKVNENGTVTRIENWTATNTEGSKRSDQYFAVLNHELATYDNSNKDAMFYSKSPKDKVWFGLGKQDITGANGGVTSANRLTIAGVNAKGTVTVVMHHYHRVSTLVGNMSLKPNYFYDINLTAKTVTPSAGTTGRRHVLSAAADNTIVRENQGITYLTSHTWYRGIVVQILSNGDRFVQALPGDGDVTLQFHLYRNLSTAGTVESGTLDANFKDVSAMTNTVSVVPPTPVRSTYQATILHDKLFVVQVAARSTATYTTGKSLALISGSPTAKTYKVLSEDTFATPVSYKGYELNDTRVALTGSVSPAIYAFRKNGTLYYHNATWTSQEPVDSVYQWGIDANGKATYQFKMLQAVATKLNNLMATFPKQGGHTQFNDSWWAVTPFYPGIGEAYVIVRFIQNYRTPNTASHDGYSRSNGYHQFVMFPATINVDASNVATLADINTSGFKAAMTAFGSQSVLHTGDVSYSYGCLAVDITANTYEILHRIGVRDYDATNVGYGPAYLQYLSFNKSRVLVKHTPNPAGYTIRARPAISPDLGLGLVRLEGIGAFYVFSRYLPDTDTLDLANGTAVVGTARPAAGFNATINTPFPVYIGGHVYTIDVQTINLTSVTSSPQNKTFYCYIEIVSNKAVFKVSTRQLEEHFHRVYVGWIKTSATEITEMNITPVTRWEIARPSIEPIGTAIPVSTGTPAETIVSVWADAPKASGTLAEYLWGDDDVLDSEEIYYIKDVYWARDASGNNKIDKDLLFGENAYLIVKTVGISDPVTVDFETFDIFSTDMAVGNIAESVTIPLSYNATTNMGFGSYQIRTKEVSEMAFSNASWKSMTGQRAIGTVYTNNTGFEIAVSVKVSALQNTRYLALLVDGNAIDQFAHSGDFWKSQMTVVHNLQAIVPAGSTYQLVNTAGSGTLSEWYELRRT